jgi:putative MATE family efflux protein
MKQNSLTNGSVFKALVIFSLPMIITNTVSILFHAADVAVLAIFVDGPAVAAVGACGSLITLMVSIFTGFATGANVLISKRIGANDEKGTRRAVGTALVIGLLSGIVLTVVALIFARSFLILMNCQEDVLDMATLYMRIYFLGMPIIMLYNFVAAILRADGDSMRPMIYMIVSGCVNIVANIFFVTIFDMTVEGVAMATVLSSAVSLVLAMIRLLRAKGICKVETAHLKIRRVELAEMVKVGIPTCFCSIFFYIANVIIAAQVNSISTNAMTANSISGQFDGIIYTVGAAIAAAAAVMVGQNYGARQFERIRRIIRVSVLYASAVSIFLGCGFVLFAEPLLSILSDDAAVIAIAKDRMTLLCLTYFVTSIMEVISFSLRSIKRQRSTMVVGAICGLGVRYVWAIWVWPLHKTLSMLYACLLISAAIAIVIYSFVYIKAMKSLPLEKHVI